MHHIITKLPLETFLSDVDCIFLKEENRPLSRFFLFAGEFLTSEKMFDCIWNSSRDFLAY
jgi:hypothetical protein